MEKTLINNVTNLWTFSHCGRGMWILWAKVGFWHRNFKKNTHIFKLKTHVAHSNSLHNLLKDCISHLFLAKTIPQTDEPTSQLATPTRNALCCQVIVSTTSTLPGPITFANYHVAHGHEHLPNECFREIAVFSAVKLSVVNNISLIFRMGLCWFVVKLSFFFSPPSSLFCWRRKLVKTRVAAAKRWNFVRF